MGTKLPGCCRKVVGTRSGLPKIAARLREARPHHEENDLVRSLHRARHSLPRATCIRPEPAQRMALRLPPGFIDAALRRARRNLPLRALALPRCFKGWGVRKRSSGLALRFRTRCFGRFRLAARSATEALELATTVVIPRTREYLPPARPCTAGCCQNRPPPRLREGVRNSSRRVPRGRRRPWSAGRLP